MSEISLDNDWFQINRSCLLKKRVPKVVANRADRRAIRSLLATAQHEGQKPFKSDPLERLAPVHAMAVRAHMQYYRSCLESIGLVPSDAFVQHAVQVEYYWFTLPPKGFYRDHLAHVMKVGTTGLFLLEKKIGLRGIDSQTLLEYIALKLSTKELGNPALRHLALRAGCTTANLQDYKFWKACVREAVRIACLLHDLDYPSQFGRKLHNAGQPFDYRVSFGDPSHGTSVGVLRYIRDHLMFTPFHQGCLEQPTGHQSKDSTKLKNNLEIFEKCMALSHSPQAGLRILEAMEESDRVWRLHPTEAFIFEWAALAATMHDLDKLLSPKLKSDEPDLHQWVQDNKKYIRPTFRTDPVSYLVALSDQLQDFGRVHYEGDSEWSHNGRNQAQLNLRQPVRSVKLGFSEDTSTNRILTATWEFDPNVPDSRRKSTADSMRTNLNTWLDSTGLFDGGVIVQ